MTIIGCAVSVWTHRVTITNYSIKKIKNSSFKSITGEDTGRSWIENWGVDGFIVVEILANKNILDLTNKHSLNFYVDAWFCKQPNKITHMGQPSLFVEGKSVNKWSVTSALTGKKLDQIPFKYNGQTVYKYNIVLYQNWVKDLPLPDAFKKDKKQTVYLKYDLKDNPQDICISLSGGGMTSEIKSNVIIIPASDIQKVFKQ